MKDIETMTPEELREHIEYCENVLHLKENARWYELVGNLASVAQELLNEYPNAKFTCTCRDTSVIEIDVDHLAYEDNYIK
jgi:hypothetical protein